MIMKTSMSGWKEAPNISSRTRASRRTTTLSSRKLRVWLKRSHSNRLYGATQKVRWRSLLLQRTTWEDPERIIKVLVSMLLNHNTNRKELWIYKTISLTKLGETKLRIKDPGTHRRKDGVLVAVVLINHTMGMLYLINHTFLAMARKLELEWWTMLKKKSTKWGLPKNSKKTKRRLRN